MGDTPALPKGQDRGMTPGEIEMAREIFGNALDYSKVRIHNGKADGIIARAESCLSKYIGMNDVDSRPQAFGNDVYFPPEQYGDDFSKPSLNRGLFIHELTHVWQSQHNLVGPAIKTVEDVVSNGLNYDKTYSYTLDPKKDLMNYNLEQQADIVEEYFGMKQRRAHPEPPGPPATPEGMESGFLGRMMLKKISEMHAAHTETLQLKEMEKSGYVAYDKEGQPHFTQKFADKTNEETKKSAAERVLRDAVLEKVMAKFAANPSYVDKPGLVEEIAQVALKAAVPVYNLGPLPPRK